MEPSRGPLRTVRLSWQGLVLAASLLTFWNEPTTAQLTIEAVPPNVAEGQDVLLRALNLGENLYGYKWFKGKCVVENCLIIRYVIASNETNKGIEHSGRETVYHNGSLLIQNVTLNDTGVYTFQAVNSNLGLQSVSVEFRIYEHVPQPSIQTTNTTVTEDDTVTLTCHTEEGHTAISIRWLFNDENLQLTDRMKLSRNNSVLTIDPVRREDAGEYQCEVSNPVSTSKSDTLRLAVILDRTGSSGLSGGAIAGIVVGSVAGVALIAALAYFLFFRKTGGARDQHHLTEHKQSPSDHSK